jgi:hypothetical protein
MVGIALLLALVVVVESIVGWRAIVGDWQAVSPQTLTIAIAFFLLSHLLRALRIYVYSAGSLGLGYTDTVKISALHQAFNNLLPMRLGEGAYPLLMRRYAGQGIGPALADLLWLRVLDMVIMGSLVLALIGGAFVGNTGMVVIGASSVLLVSVLLDRIIVSARDGVRTAPPGRMAAVVATLAGRAPATLGQQMLLLLLTLAAWSMKLLGLLVLLQSMTELPLNTVITGLVGGELSGVLPIHGLGGAGTYEAAFVGAGALGGEAGDLLLQSAVNAHIFVLLSTCGLAALTLLVPVDKVRDNSGHSNQ